MRRLHAAAVSLLLFAGTAYADDTPPVGDWSMEVVVAEADAQGPALWHIKKGDSEIWVLGTVGLMPSNLVWNSTHLAQVIDGSNAVLLPPQARSGMLDLLGLSWFILMHRDALSMPGDEKLEPSLSPELRTRFVNAREAIRKQADRYEDDSPLLAGFKLLGDYIEAGKLAPDVTEKAVEKIAGAKHVKVRRIAEYSANPLIKEMLQLPREAGQVCFEHAVSDYETLNRHAVPAADAWAVGDVAGIKANYSTSLFLPCIGQAKKFGEINHQAVDDTVKAVNEALAKPGKSVLVIDVGWLFRTGGVADVLRSEGLTIEGPPEKRDTPS
jgi:uncharacterized protein YbaP (TraB family)